MVGWGLILYVGGLRLYVGAWYSGSHIVGDVPTVVENLGNRPCECAGNLEVKSFYCERRDEMLDCFLLK